MNAVEKQRRDVRAALEKIVLRPGPPGKDGRDSWSGNMRMLLYTLVWYGIERASDPMAFEVRGTYSDCLHQWRSTEKILEQVWSGRRAMPTELAPHAKFYGHYKSLSGQKVRVTKTVGDNYKQLVAISGDGTKGAVAKRSPMTINVRRDERASPVELTIRVQKRVAAGGAAETRSPEVIRLPPAPGVALTRRRRMKLSGAIRVAVEELSEASFTDAAADVYDAVARADPDVAEHLKDIAPPARKGVHQKLFMDIGYAMMANMFGVDAMQRIRRSRKIRGHLDGCATATAASVDALAYGKIRSFAERKFQVTVESIQWTGKFYEIPASEEDRNDMRREFRNAMLLMSVLIAATIVRTREEDPTARFWEWLAKAIKIPPTELQTSYVRDMHKALEVLWLTELQDFGSRPKTRD